MQAEQDTEQATKPDSGPSGVDWLRGGSWALGGMSVLLWLLAGGLAAADATLDLAGTLVAICFALAIGATVLAAVLAVAASIRRRMALIEETLGELSRQLGRNAALLEQQAHRPQRGNGRRRRPRIPRQLEAGLEPDVLGNLRRINAKLTGTS